MAEWSIAFDLKSNEFNYSVSSNLTLSFFNLQSPNSISEFNLRTKILPYSSNSVSIIFLGLREDRGEKDKELA